LKKPISELFAEFDPQPLASASIAQVHTAKLHSGEEVVVKILRPNIEKQVARDMALLKSLARWLERLVPPARRFFPTEVVKDYESTITAELDLGREASNMLQFSRNFKYSPLLYVPKVYPDYTRTRVLVMERIYGVPVTDLKSIEAAGISREVLARRGIEIFFTQVFRDNFFHADMHPGNIFVSLENPDNPQYIALDCAIVGSMDRAEQVLLARQLMAFIQQDYEQLAQLMGEAGWVSKNIRVHEFANALRAVMEPVFEKPLDQIDFGPILIRLFRTARQYDLHALPQFVLLEKTLLHVEGLGRQLYPQLDIWTIGRPMLESWLKEQLGPQAFWRELKRNLPAWLEQMTQLPNLTHRVLNQARTSGDFQRAHAEEMRDLREKIATNQRRDQAVLAISLMLFGGAVFLSQSPDISLASVSPTATLLGLGGLLMALSRLTK
ncbi:MAG TPA: AarF/UbiB family protein, partial [Pseudomonadales bacterium]|nr:AarF/UbiB family protein [Pseudomonadales bacterium]